jgi:hypothetical protein
MGKFPYSSMFCFSLQVCSSSQQSSAGFDTRCKSQEAITVGELCKHLLFANFELHEFIIFRNDCSRDCSRGIRLILNYRILKHVVDDQQASGRTLISEDARRIYMTCEKLVSSIFTLGGARRRRRSCTNRNWQRKTDTDWSM